VQRACVSIATKHRNEPRNAGTRDTFLARDKNVRVVDKGGRGRGGGAMSTTVTTTAPKLPADLRDAFDRLVADAVGDFRQTPLARLVVAHLVFFAELRRRGASWAQIAALLAAGGVIGSNGAFTAEVLRATYARAAADAAQRKRTERNTTRRSVTKRKVTQRDVAQAREAQRHLIGQDTSERNATAANETPRNGPVRQGPRASRNALVGDANDLARRASLIDKPWHS
jgi:hypothetical protein